MALSNTFSMAVQAFREAKYELAQRKSDMGLGTSEGGAETVEMKAIEGAGIPLGIAEDGLPILVDLYEATPCPMIVIGERGTGKSRLLRWLAKASEQVRMADDIRFGVLTQETDGWKEIESLPGSIGVWGLDQPATGQFLHQLVSWAQESEHGKQVIILLVDDLRNATQTSAEFQADLRWLLQNGGKNRVWTIAGVDVYHALRLRGWLDLFRTKLFGYIQQPSLAQVFTQGEKVEFDLLRDGMEFALKQADGWMKFSLPGLVS